jgi:hypothetical protein
MLVGNDSACDDALTPEHRQTPCPQEVSTMDRSRRLIGITLGVLLVLAAVPAANAGAHVDPDTLTPPPPPGATCQAVGPTAVICHTAISFPASGDPLFDVACGTIYQWGTDDRYGIRWYENGLMTRRFYRGVLDGTWSLAPDGSGLSIAITGNWTNWSIWSVPGDDDTLVQTDYGLEFHATVPGLGGSLLLAGQIEFDGTVHGVNRVDEPIGEISPASIALLESLFCD